LVENLAGAAILLVGTYRPGYRPPWMDKSYTTQLSLHRLTSKDSLTVVHSVLPAGHLPDPVAQLILDKAEGNPFFLEELTRSVAEQAGPPGDLTVPDTIHGVLMARIDRLPEEPKRVLQTVAVLGREFSLRLLTAIWDGPGVLEPYLLELRRLEFLYERLAADEPTYVFKHALTQDVAYDSLLVNRRQALHAAAGRALEHLYAERLDDVSERLAHHYGQAELADKAVEYLIRSADKAARVYANADAVTALETALRHVDRLPPAGQDRPLVGIVLRLAHSFYFLARVRDTLDLLQAHRGRLENLRDPTLAGPYYFWLSHTYSYLSEYDRASEAARRALEEATRCGDDATLGKAQYMVARIGFGAGRFREGVDHGRRAIPLLERAEEWLWVG
jgi:predicted ATPase